MTHAIDISEVGQFPYLLEQVETHRAYLAGNEMPGATVQQAAEDWYTTIYQPMSGIIQKADLLTEEVTPDEPVTASGISDSEVEVAFLKEMKRRKDA